MPVLIFKYSNVVTVFSLSHTTKNKLILSIIIFRIKTRINVYIKHFKNIIQDSFIEFLYLPSRR